MNRNEAIKLASNKKWLKHINNDLVLQSAYLADNPTEDAD